MMKHRAMALAFLLLSASLLPACGGPGRGGPKTHVALQVEALDGGVIDLGRYRGQPVVLHFFTTYSLAAQNDVPQLIAAHERHGDELTIIGVALDLDGYRLVSPWRTASGVTYLVALGSTDLMEGRSSLGRIVQVPTTVIVDRDSSLLERIDGALRPGQLAELLEPLVPRDGSH